LREALVEATSQIGATDLASGKVADSDEAEDALDWSNRGYGYAQMGDLEEALRCYRHGLAVLAATKRGDDVLITQGVDKQINSTDGAFVILQTNMGAVLARLQRFDEAREAYEAALAVVPDDGVSYFRLGEIALREGRVADGLSLIKKGTQCEPGNWDLLLKYIRACLRFGSKAESEAHLRAFLSAKKTDSPFIVGVGCALDDEFGPEVAVRCFDAALEHDEDYAAAWYNRGVALHRAGKFLEATKCYENTVRLDRNHVFARCYLGATLLAQGRRDEAEQQFKRFLQSAAPSPLTNLVAMAIQGSAFGLPLESLLSPLNEAQAIKHVM
jgi:tetratricopeptide (TPR) repeat protein